MNEKTIIKFNNSYNNLPSDFYSNAQAMELENPKLIIFNWDLAVVLFGAEVKNLSDEEISQIFSGQKLIEGSANIATVYAGHQFGHFNPQLGDGRAMLLGEVLNSNKQRFDIQLKGSGPTVFSRRGDGKSSLGPVIREYIVSEAMYFLGVPTTRALCAIESGEKVYREVPHPGGIFTRIASSHIRVGTFEFFAGRGDTENLKILTNYTINRHYPSAKGDYLKLLRLIADKQSSLVANWMSKGFIHGVMNTDNMSITGETIDYGPCAFMDHFQKNKRFSSVDQYSRYAYNQQIKIAKWNFTRLASTLLPLINSDIDLGIEIVQKEFHDLEFIYESQYLDSMTKKFGFFEAKLGDEKVIDTWLTYLEEESLDFTNSFRALSSDKIELKQTKTYNHFYALWQERLNRQEETEAQVKELMNSVNPIFIARNHQVERAIQAVYQNQDYSIFNTMIELLKNPYSEQEGFDEFKLPPTEFERVKATFCGT